MTPTAEAELLADKILRAAGSGLRHYTPESRDRIISVTQIEIAVIKQSVPAKLDAE